MYAARAWLLYFSTGLQPCAESLFRDIYFCTILYICSGMRKYSTIKILIFVCQNFAGGLYVLSTKSGYLTKGSNLTPVIKLIPCADTGNITWCQNQRYITLQNLVFITYKQSMLQRDFTETPRII